jgi:hypothetical protein
MIRIGYLMGDYPVDGLPAGRVEDDHRENSGLHVYIAE